MAAFACYLAKWLALDLLPWTQRVYMLTDRRLIAQEGLLAVRRRECSLLKIEESDYASRGPMARLLDSRRAARCAGPVRGILGKSSEASSGQ